MLEYNTLRKLIRYKLIPIVDESKEIESVKKKKKDQLLSKSLSFNSPSQGSKAKLHFNFVLDDYPEILALRGIHHAAKERGIRRFFHRVYSYIIEHSKPSMHNWQNNNELNGEARKKYSVEANILRNILRYDKGEKYRGKGI